MYTLKYSLFAYFLMFVNSLFALEDPSIKLKESVSNVLGVLYDESFSKKEASKKESIIIDKLAQHYDMDVIIRRCIGRNWKKIEESSQPVVLSLIKRLVVRAYCDGMKGQEKPDIKFKDTVLISDKRAEVETSILLGNSNINLTYKFGKMKSGWQIFDIVIENISLVVTYRNQFDAFFTNNNSEALVKQLRKLLLDEDLGQKLPI
tara:strand:- start:59 stop:673 length:615 start_codon:yes stop_codon:yes gene_type:complete